ncbi:MAG: TatD family hydrolase [Bacteroidota bacterium]
MFVDTHAHLFYKDFDNQIDEVLQRAKDAGVDSIVVPGTDIDSSYKAIRLAEKYEMIYAAVGVHPLDSKDWTSAMLDELFKMAEHEKVVAVGEIGLDYYYDYSPKDVQLRAFEAQLELALQEGLPVIIHNRDAGEDVMRIIRGYGSTSLRAQFHCFAGSLEDARELIRMNHLISFTGNITYKKSEIQHEILRNIQVEDLLLETDCPYMAPVPFRGKTNEPAYVRHAAEKIAELQNISIENVGQATSYNAFSLFGIGEKSSVSFTYEIGDSLYVNITNRCNSDCVFCDRKGEAVIKGYNLKMPKSMEPPASVYISEIGDPKKYREIVFCGYGEPTIRWEVVREISRYVKANGGKTRMNTDGHGNYINKRDITPELKGVIDTVSISLNSVDPEQYSKLMRVDPKLHAEMIDFARRAKNYTEVVMTIVGLNEVDEQRAKEFVQSEIGVSFRTRNYF